MFWNIAFELTAENLNKHNHNVLQCNESDSSYSDILMTEEVNGVLDTRIVRIKKQKKYNDNEYNDKECEEYSLNESMYLLKYIYIIHYIYI